MALSQKLELRQSQALVMTPQLMQAIKLLQLSNLDLAAYVEAELEQNPLLERIDDPEKNWKFSMADVEERRFWKEYRSAYEDCLSQTSTKDSPWHVVPADDKLNARLIVSSVILDTLKDLKMSYPPTSDERREELQKFREQLA